MSEILVKNLDTIAAITIVAALISIASWLGLWGDAAAPMMQSEATGSKAAGNLMRFLGFLSLPVTVLGAVPTGLWLFLKKQGSGRAI